MEAASVAPSTPKVIIQCTDPDNLLETFESRLSNRIPLRNLHWKSSNRPLRSIPSLNVSLVRKDPSQNGTQSGARRHQIPGLRETPYLKLYLLRCDDKETYKDSARQEIKQWIKDNTLEKESKSSLRNHELHDAYEWMIVHVVVPNTVAASQPKSTKHVSIDATESTDSVNSKSKWTGKSSSTIFDKLRADFDKSKSSVTRVSQVRLTERGKPQGALPPVDVEEQWQDLIENFKAAILKSFDTRVSQYEEDIRERENQRNLPGWNFCTFFVLKEGLARGFENVGLLDDALAVYSELEIGLDMVVKEGYEQDDVDTAGALLPYAKHLKTLIRKALDDTSGDHDSDFNSQIECFTLEKFLITDAAQLPFEVEKHNYRDLILKNEVSALDLRIYMFTRKMEIRLRQSRLFQSLNQAGKSSQTDLNVLADFAELALGFVNLAAREYRADLYAAWGGHLSGRERVAQGIVIDNVVATWTWSAVTQILARLLPVLDSSVLLCNETTETILTNILAQNSESPIERRPVSRDRRSSLSHNASPSRDARSQSLPRMASQSKDSLGVQGHRTKPVPRPGLERLCVWLARLLLLGRTVLEGLPATLPWSDPLSKIELAGVPRRSKNVHRLSSYATSASANGNIVPTENGPNLDNKLLCLDSVVLMNAARSQETFVQLYRLLSAYACHLFNSVNHYRALNQVLIELSAQAYNSGKKMIAAEYLSRVLDAELQDGIRAQEPLTLALYAACLEHARRPNQYVLCLLACLQSSSTGQSVEVAQGYFDELVKIAPLANSIDLPLNVIVSIQEADRSISHSDHSSGFYLSLRHQSKFRARLVVKEPLKLYLAAAGSHEPHQLILNGPSELDLQSTLMPITFTSNVSTEGWYLFERLEMKIGNLIFVHSFQTDSEAPGVRPRNFEPPSVMVYPSLEELTAELMPAATIILGEIRLLSLIIRSGGNEVSQIAVRLRSASAGLRLQLHDSTSKASIEVTRKEDTSILHLDGMKPRAETTIQVPYSLESGSDPSIVVKCQINFKMNDEIFVFYKTCNINVILPISVNVQDIHRDSYWFSKFLVRPATLVPIVLWGCSIEDGAVTVTGAEDAIREPLVVFPQQPANWIVRLNQRGRNGRLRLNVRYQCMDELILNKLRDHFVSALKNSPNHQASSLLASHLVQTIRNGWTEQDLEVAALTQEIDMWRMSDMDWPSVLCAFERTTKEAVKTWLEKWHSHTSPISIELDQAPVRLLQLPVDLPPRPPIVKTGFQLMNNTSTVPVGQPLMCEVNFEMFINEANDTQEIEFSYELFAPLEAWLIGGRRKGSFNKDFEGTRLRIILFPQRTGVLLLPTIDVRCRRRDETSSMEARPWVDVPLEVHNCTMSKSLQVMPSLKSTTIGLMSEGGSHMSSGLMIGSNNRQTNAL